MPTFNAVMLNKLTDDTKCVKVGGSYGRHSQQGE